MENSIQKRFLLLGFIWWIMLVSFALSGTGRLGILWIATSILLFIRCSAPPQPEDEKPRSQAEIEAGFFSLVVKAMEGVGVALLIAFMAGALAMLFIKADFQPVTDGEIALAMSIGSFFYIYATLAMIGACICLVQGSHELRHTVTAVVVCTFFAFVRYTHLEGLAHLKEDVEMFVIGIPAAIVLFFSIRRYF